MSNAITRNLTILLTDIKGFTDKTSRKSRSEIQEMLDQHKKIVLPILETKGGKLIKTIGDAFLMAFDSPTDAVLAGVAVQEALSKHNTDKPDADRLEVRIAINTGEVNLVENDIFGEPVNITARIEGIAQAGEVFFTEAVYLAMNKTEVPSSEVGLLQLKGIPEKIRVYKVKREHPVAGLAQAPNTRTENRSKIWQRLIPATASSQETFFEPPAKAKILGSFKSPPFWRRTTALIIDLIICVLIAGFLTGSHRDDDDVDVEISQNNPATTAAGQQIKSQGGQKKIQGVNISINGSDISIGTGKNSEGLAISQDSSKWDRSTQKHHYVFAILWLVYFLLFVRLMGATPGMRIMKLAVVECDGKSLDPKAIIFRSACSLLSGYALLLGYIWGIFEKDRRTWHDLLAGTRVVMTD